VRPSPPFTVILFDVDGTLVLAAGAGRRSLEAALAEACGPLDGRLAPLRLDGMTDRLIVREAFGLLGREFSEAACDAVLARYLEHLARELGHPAFSVLPGVVDALEALGARGAAYGLCTGNVAPGARLKLARGGLDRYFDWSEAGVHGFGDDGEARELLVHAALARASARLGRRVEPREVLVVGDTPRDVAAAHHAGCPALAVATGRFTADDLAAAGADFVAPDLGSEAARGLLAR
jgi:phosphoglycolate phosphatase-like HAD superfamily hydrolase